MKKCRKIFVKKTEVYSSLMCVYIEDTLFPYCVLCESRRDAIFHLRNARKGHPLGLGFKRDLH